MDLHMEVGDTAELRSWVLSHGSGARVLEPESLRLEVLKELRNASEIYATPARSTRS